MTNYSNESISACEVKHDNPVLIPIRQAYEEIMHSINPNYDKRNIMNKVVRDGLVAVLYSPGFGSGWYTWNTEYPDILYDAKVVEWVEADNPEDQLSGITAYLEATYPKLYIGSGLRQLEIEWLPVGTRFRVHEYDGSERIEIRDKVVWQIA